MITAIEIQNFQSHKNTRIEFCDGVNTILGLSDSGKSAVFRALNWVFNNRPSGDGFRSNWGGDTKVVVWFEDGLVVTRLRTNTDNMYAMQTQDEGSYREYRAFGQDVPEEVRAALNLTYINFQGQMDGPFLLSQSPGEVAQILNKVVNLDVIDRAVSNIRKKKSDADRELKNLQERHEKLNTSLSKYDHVDKADKDVSELEELEKKLDEVHKDIHKLSSMVWDVSKANESSAVASRLLRGEELVNEVDGMLLEFNILSKRVSTLNGIANQIVELEDRLEKANTLLSAAGLLEITLNLVADKRKGDNRGACLDSMIDQVISKQNDLSEKSKQAHKLGKEFEEAMPEQCPLCGK